MKKNELNFLHGIYATVLAIAFLLFGGLIMTPIFGEKGSLYAGIPIALIGVGFTYFTKTKPKEVFPFALPPIKTFFGAILLAIGVRLFSTAVSVAVSLLFDPNVRSDEINSILLKMSPLTAVIVLAVFPAICEEFFCRGFLVKCFSKIKNEKIIILITSVIFGIMHLDPYSFFYTAIFGALLCYVAINTKSLLIPIFLHFASNALSVVLTFSTASLPEVDQTAELTMNLGQNLSLVLFYLGACAMPLYIGYRLFNGQRIRGKAFIVSIIVCIVLISAALYLMSTSSFVKVDSGNETITYEDTLDEKITLDINEKGNYLISATINCNDKIDVYLMCGEEEVYKDVGSGMLFISVNFECSDENSEYYILIRNNEEDNEVSGSVIYSYRIEKVNL